MAVEQKGTNWHINPPNNQLSGNISNANSGGMFIIANVMSHTARFTKNAFVTVRMSRFRSMTLQTMLFPKEKFNSLSIYTLIFINSIYTNTNFFNDNKEKANSYTITIPKLMPTLILILIVTTNTFTVLKLIPTPKAMRKQMPTLILKLILLLTQN